MINVCFCLMFSFILLIFLFFFVCYRFILTDSVVISLWLVCAILYIYIHTSLNSFRSFDHSVVTNYVVSMIILFNQFLYFILFYSLTLFLIWMFSSLQTKVWFHPFSSFNSFSKMFRCRHRKLNFPNKNKLDDKHYII